MTQSKDLVANGTGRRAEEREHPAMALSLRPLACAILLPAFAILLALALLPKTPWLDYHTFVVQGGSMEPNIHQGSLVLSKPVPPQSLQLGDVVVFSTPWASYKGQPRTVIHRITHLVPLDKGVLSFTQGDASTLPDPAPTPLTGEVNRVSVVAPYLGYIYPFVERWGGALLLMVSLALLTLLHSGAPRSDGREPVGTVESVAVLPSSSRI